MAVEQSRRVGRYDSGDVYNAGCVKCWRSGVLGAGSW